MTTIKKDILHPENEPDTNIYPKTSIDQVENLQANLDAINGDISNVNGEIAALSTNVSDITTRVSTSERNITDLQNDVNQNIIDISDIKSDITTLNTAYDYFTDYTIVNNVLKLQYRSGYEFELPLKAGTNVTFSKYPGSNYLIINSTGGSVPDNIALLDANNNWSAVNKFYEYIQCNRGIKIYSNETNEGIVIDSYTITINGSIPTREDLKIEYVYQKGYALNTITKNGGSSTYNRLIIPIKNSTIATIDDIPVIPDLGNFTFSNNNMNINGSTAISRSTGSPTEFIFGNYDNTFRSASSGLFTFYNQNAYAVINLAGKTGPQTIAFKSDIPNTSSFATLAGNNNWTGQNEFSNGISMYGGSYNTEYTVEGARVTDGDYKANYGGRWITTEYQGQSGTINIPQGKSGTMALVEDIPNTSSFATLAGNNKWTGDNIFDGFSKSIRVNGLFQVSGDEELISATYNQVSYDGFNIAYMVGENQNIFHVGIDFENKARFGFDKYDGSSYNLYIPEKDGTIALLSDIPISLMYSSSRLGENSVDFPFNIDKNYFFTITMTNTGESKSFIYAKGTSSTYTIVINSSTSFEVKLDATGSSTRLIFTTKSNTDPFVVRAEISN